jgi:hypothetical protein
MARTAVTLEIDQPGESAEAILEAIATAFEVSRETGRERFQVSAEDVSLGALRERIARTATTADPEWDNYMHFDFS